MVKILDVPVDRVMSPPTTEEDVRDEQIVYPESKAETDEEMLRVDDEVSNQGLAKMRSP